MKRLVFLTILLMVVMVVMVACTNQAEPEQELIPAKDDFGRITITSDPEGAKIWIDNEPAGRTNITSEPLPPGMHDLRFEYPGYVDLWKKVYVYPSHTSETHAVLFKEE